MNKEKRTQLLNILPKYIFDAEHSKLKSVDSIIKSIHEHDATLHTGEVSEYPIEYYENQQHAIQRHMNITYVDLVFKFLARFSPVSEGCMHVIVDTQAEPLTAKAGLNR